MTAVRLRGRLAAALIIGLLAIGPLATSASAQQPSDPSSCSSSQDGQDPCPDGSTDPADVLSDRFDNSPGGGSPLPKTGGDYALLALAGVLITAAGVALRRAAKRT
jgi:LPXTG-motif cell wall-anchored protein